MRANDQSHKCTACYEYFVWFCRLWGIATCLVLWGVGMELTYDSDLIGYYILACAFLLSMTETVFLLHLAITECQSEVNGTCAKLWKALLWFDDWKKTVLYALLAIFCIMYPFLKTAKAEAWLSGIAGTMLVISAILYLLKGYSHSRIPPPEIPQNNGNAYTRISRPTEDLGSGSINNDIPPGAADTISIQSGTALLASAQDSSLAEQTEIMEA